MYYRWPLQDSCLPNKPNPSRNNEHIDAECCDLNSKCYCKNRCWACYSEHRMPIHTRMPIHSYKPDTLCWLYQSISKHHFYWCLFYLNSFRLRSAFIHTNCELCKLLRNCYFSNLQLQCCNYLLSHKSYHHVLGCRFNVHAEPGRASNCSIHGDISFSLQLPFYLHTNFHKECLSYFVASLDYFWCRYSTIQDDNYCSCWCRKLCCFFYSNHSSERL